MITAIEAKKITSETLIVPDNIQKEIERLILEAANEGKTTVDLVGVILYDLSVHIESFESIGQKQTKNQKAVLKLLGENGFKVSYEPIHNYVPPGLMDSNGDGPTYTQYAMRVKWN